MRPVRLLTPLLSLFTLVLSACGGGDGGATPPASITVSASPAALTVVQGGTGAVDVTVTRANFSGAVTVSAEGLPSGVTATVTPAQLTATSTSAQVMVSASSSAPTGTYTITVRGTASGVSAQTTYALTIVAPPDFSLTAAPATASVSAATTATSTISVVRTGGFTGAVDFSLQSAQAGITGVFTPASSSAPSVSLVISATSAVPLGTYIVTVSGNGAGIGVRTTTISVTVLAPPDYALSATPSTVTINAGASGTTSVAVTRSGGFTGGVSLSLQSAQAGITGVFTPTVADASASLSVNVQASVPPGTYPTTVVGTASGVASRSTALTVTVAETPRIAIAAVPTSLSVAVGASGSSTITLTRTNFTGAVSLAATGQPSGVAVTIDPHPNLPNTFVVSLSVGGAAVVGIYPITVTATGAGVANALATVTLTVAAAASTEFRYCASGQDLRDGFGNPVWFAYQDGNGAWTRVLPTTAGGVISYRFPLAATTGAVATITPIVFVIRQTPDAFTLAATQMSNARRGERGPHGRRFAAALGTPATFYSTRIDYGTREELLALGASGGCVSTFVKRNTGSFLGLGAGEFGSVWLGGTQGSAASLNPNYALDVPLDGTQSLLAMRSGAGNVFDRLYVRRDVNQPNNGVLPLTDFADAARSFAPLERAVTLTNGLGDLLNASAMFRLMPSGQSAILPNGNASTATTRAYRTLPLAPRMTGEGDEIFATATLQNQAIVSLNYEQRSVFAVPTVQGGDVSIAFGARLVAPTVTAVSGVTVTRERINGTLPSDYGEFTTVTVEESSGSNQHTFAFSAAYRAATGIGSNYQFTFPDFTAVPGFLPEAALMRGLVYVNTFSDGTTGGSRASLTPGRIYRTVLRMVETSY